MQLTISSFIIACPLIFLAGFVDSIAGGGGLISIPAYLLAGLPPHAAVATNKISSTSGTVVSVARFIKNGYRDFGLAVPAIAAAIAGGQAGARAALIISDEALKVFMLITLPLIALFLFFKKDMKPKEGPPVSRRAQLIAVIISTFIIGIYDGIYGPGTGTFLILCYTFFARLDVLTASGNTKISNLVSNLSALTVYLTNGTAVLPLGAACALFCMAGHYFGSSFAIKSGAKGIRYAIFVVIGLLFVKIALELL